MQATHFDVVSGVAVKPFYPKNLQEERRWCIYFSLDVSAIPTRWERRKITDKILLQLCCSTLFTNNTSCGGVSILITSMQISWALIGPFALFDKVYIGRIWLAITMSESSFAPWRFHASFFVWSFENKRGFTCYWFQLRGRRKCFKSESSVVIFLRLRKTPIN